MFPKYHGGGDQLVLHICLRLTFLNFVYIRLHTGACLGLLYIYEWSFLARVPSRENVWLILLWMKTASGVRQTSNTPLVLRRARSGETVGLMPSTGCWSAVTEGRPTEPQVTTFSCTFSSLTCVACCVCVWEERCWSGHFKLYTD